MDLNDELARFEAEVLGQETSAQLPPPPGPPPRSTVPRPSGPPPAIAPPPGVLPKPPPRPPSSLPPPPRPAQQPLPRPPAVPPPVPARPPGAPPPLVARPAGAPPPIAPPASEYATAAQSHPPPQHAASSQAQYSQAYAYSNQQAGVDQARTSYAFQAAEQPAPANAPAMPTALDAAAIRDEILSAPKNPKKKKKEISKDATVRVAGGEVWRDDTLDQWPKNDFRIFVGNLGPEVTEDVLAKAFQPFPSYAKCRVIKCFKQKKTKGYGFVSFLDAAEGTKALRTMDGKYIGNRPCMLKKSNCEDRTAPDQKGKRKAMLMNPMMRMTTKRMR